MRIQSAALSDVGLKRRTNQDAFLVDNRRRLYLLADGMGGHAAGALASEIAVNSVNDFIERALETGDLTWPFGYDVQTPFEYNVLRNALQLANLSVLEESRRKLEHAGMGSTAVAVWVRDGKAFFSHVGDSRLYLMRAGELFQLTEDHSLIQDQIRQGLLTDDEARNHRLRHIITRVIGGRETLEVEVQELDLYEGDQLLLCCDGLSDKVEPQDLCRILYDHADLEEACKLLIEAAKEAGGEDNITAVVVRYRAGPEDN